ncbi:MAG: MFS transporter [Candidatus Binatia bacterium]
MDQNLGARTAGVSKPGYFEILGGFSRNAKLFIIHFMMMAFRFGMYVGIFNLYLLALGFSPGFAGMRIFLFWGSISLGSVFMGRVVDRIGRRISFIFSDGMGVIMTFFMVAFPTAEVLITLSIISGFIDGLHWSSEAPWIMENSEDEERVYLFSVTQGMGRIAMMFGQGLPFLFVGNLPNVSLPTYRIFLYTGLVIWMLSLVPALMFREKKEILDTLKRASKGSKWLFSFENVESWPFVKTMVPIYALMWLGIGMIHPLHTVFFANRLGAAPMTASLILALGGISMSLGSFLIPIVAERIGRVRTISYTMLFSIPFTLGVGVVPVLIYAAIFFLLHELTIHVFEPIVKTFYTESVQTKERGTVSGMMTAAQTFSRGLGSFAAGKMMDSNYYVHTYLIMAVIFAAAALIFLNTFRLKEKEKEAAKAAELRLATQAK